MEVEQPSMLQAGLQPSARSLPQPLGVVYSVKWPSGVGGKGNEGVTNILLQTPGAISYVEYTYALQNNLSTATLQSKDQTWVTPTFENFVAAAANASWKKEEHFDTLLLLQSGANSYPIVSGTFILLPKEKIEQNKKVAAFFLKAFEQGGPTAQKLGYIPLQPSTVKEVTAYLKENGVL